MARTLPCAIPIAPKERSHTGTHRHSTAKNVFHFCQATCVNCAYICTLPLGLCLSIPVTVPCSKQCFRQGHTQPEHDTAHGSMDQTAWAVEGTQDVAVEVQGRRFGGQDSGAPHLCNLVCSQLGRHAHVDYCRSHDGPCQGNDSSHIDMPMLPNPKRPKDWVSHALFWKRTGAPCQLCASV